MCSSDKAYCIRNGYITKLNISFPIKQTCRSSNFIKLTQLKSKKVYFQNKLWLAVLLWKWHEEVARCYTVLQLKELEALLWFYCWLPDFFKNKLWLRYVVRVFFFFFAGKIQFHRATLEIMILNDCNINVKFFLSYK